MHHIALFRFLSLCLCLWRWCDFLDLIFPPVFFFFLPLSSSHVYAQAHIYSLARNHLLTALLPCYTGPNCWQQHTVSAQALSHICHFTCMSSRISTSFPLLCSWLAWGSAVSWIQHCWSGWSIPLPPRFKSLLCMAWPCPPRLHMSLYSVSQRRCPWKYS